VERLQKILSQAGVASRRASEQLMIDGRVTINGATIRELGTRADASRDDIRVDGRRIKLPERHRYLLLNKPRGFVTTRSDPERRPTVMDLVSGVSDYLYPVGRLDYDTEGLLLMTNDGDLAARLTHPSHGVPRVYEARVLGVPDAHDIERLMKGVTIDGRRTRHAAVQLLPGRQQGHAALRITIREGRNRQVRDMFDAIGHPVDQLTRIAIGPLRDSRLKVGHWRNLSVAEIEALKRAAATTHRPKGRVVQEGRVRQEGPVGQVRQDGRVRHEGHVRQDEQTRQKGRTARPGAEARTKLQGRARTRPEARTKPKGRSRPHGKGAKPPRRR
jgi:23S rRNA pseudouridine2605 synthase